MEGFCLVRRLLSVFHLVWLRQKRIDREGLGESRTGTRQGNIVFALNSQNIPLKWTEQASSVKVPVA